MAEKLETFFLLGRTMDQSYRNKCVSALGGVFTVDSNKRPKIILITDVDDWNEIKKVSNFSFFLFSFFSILFFSLFFFDFF